MDRAPRFTSAPRAAAAAPPPVIPARPWLDRLRVKLFLAIAGVNAVLVVLAYVVFSYTFDRGFVEYVERMDQARLDELVVRLADIHVREGGWDGLAADRDRFVDLARDALGLSRIVRMGGQTQPITAVPARTREFPLTIEPRLALFDATGRLLVGREDMAERAVRKPIPAAGPAVGYLGYVPRPQFVETIERMFSARQHSKFFAIALGMLLAGLVVAAGLAHWLARRTRTLADGTAALMRGDYGVRVPVDGRDELGQLASDFNRLAETLEAARRARQRWLADIAHELRTPLAVLRGEIEALQDGVRPLGPASLASLEQEAARLARLVEDLHLLSMSDLGALDYHKEPVALAETIRHVVEAQRRALEERGLAVTLALDPDVAVFADETRLAQVFANLLQNTLRYTDPGGALRVTAIRDGNHARVEWEDSAPGVPPEDLKRLGDPLFRVEGSRSRASGGSGLGLAIVKAIVEAHHGTLAPGASALGGLGWRIELPLAVESGHV